jgi:hypothetical protein
MQRCKNVQQQVGQKRAQKYSKSQEILFATQQKKAKKPVNGSSASHQNVKPEGRRRDDYYRLTKVDATYFPTESTAYWQCMDHCYIKNNTNIQCSFPQKSIYSLSLKGKKSSFLLDLNKLKLKIIKLNNTVISCTSTSTQTNKLWRGGDALDGPDQGLLYITFVYAIPVFQIRYKVQIVI